VSAVSGQRSLHGLNHVRRWGGVGWGPPTPTLPLPTPSRLGPAVAEPILHALSSWCVCCVMSCVCVRGSEGGRGEGGCCQGMRCVSCCVCAVCCAVVGSHGGVFPDKGPQITQPPTHPPAPHAPHAATRGCKLSGRPRRPFLHPLCPPPHTHRTPCHPAPPCCAGLQVGRALRSRHPDAEPGWIHQLGGYRRRG
jgi:hypothetical protein